LGPSSGLLKISGASLGPTLPAPKLLRDVENTDILPPTFESGNYQAELTIIFEQLCAGGEGSTRTNLINKLLSRGISPGITAHL